jgi:hypothetical protein
MAKRKIDWLNHFLEFIVVVIGILLAFQLNAYAEQNKEKELIVQHSNNIIQETEVNRNNVLRSLKSTEAGLAMLDTLLRIVDKPERLEREHFITFKLMASVDFMYFKKNAYNTIVTTGDIRFVEDFQYQNDLVGLYEYYQWAEGVDMMVRGTFTDYYYPFIMNNLDLATAQLQSVETYNSKEFRNILASFSYSMAARKKKQEETLGEIQKFLDKYQVK